MCVNCPNCRWAKNCRDLKTPKTPKWQKYPRHPRDKNIENTRGRKEIRRFCYCVAHINFENRNKLLMDWTDGRKKKVNILQQIFLSFQNSCNAEINNENKSLGNEHQHVDRAKKKHTIFLNLIWQWIRTKTNHIQLYSIQLVGNGIPPPLSHHMCRGSSFKSPLTPTLQSADKLWKQTERHCDPLSCLEELLQGNELGISVQSWKFLFVVVVVLLWLERRQVRNS